MSALVFGCFFLLALLGIPIAHALVFGTTLAMATAPRGNLSLIVEQMVAQIGSFPLLAIPFFMLTGSLMMGGTLGRNLLDFISTLMARFHGGAGQVGVLSSTIFGGISGSAVADASAIGSLLIPWQKKLGYPPGFAAATIASAATIDILIPPSIPFIIYALVSRDLDRGPVRRRRPAGAACCAAASCWSATWSAGRAASSARSGPINLRILAREFGYSLPGHPAPGADHHRRCASASSTPTEVSVLAAAYALVVSVLLYRDLSWKRLLDCITEAGVATGIVLLVIMASSVVGWIVTFEQIPAAVTGLDVPAHHGGLGDHRRHERDHDLHRHVPRPAGRRPAAHADLRAARGQRRHGHGPARDHDGREPGHGPLHARRSAPRSSSPAPSPRCRWARS